VLAGPDVGPDCTVGACRFSILSGNPISLSSKLVYGKHLWMRHLLFSLAAGYEDAFWRGKTIGVHARVAPLKVKSGYHMSRLDATVDGLLISTSFYSVQHRTYQQYRFVVNSELANYLKMFLLPIVFCNSMKCGAMVFVEPSFLRSSYNR
jgi:hypothetical protein